MRTVYVVTHPEQWPMGYSRIEIIVEESLEMIGILLFIRALFLYIESLLPIVWVDSDLSLTLIEKDELDEVDKVAQLSKTA